MTDRSSYRAMSRWSLVARFTLLGAFAGVLSWALVFALHVVFEVTKPSIPTLLWAVPRGAFFGALLGLFLYAKWRRRDHSIK
jgi:hypothetical protein